MTIHLHFAVLTVAISPSKAYAFHPNDTLNMTTQAASASESDRSTTDLASSENSYPELKKTGEASPPSLGPSLNEDMSGQAGRVDVLGGGVDGEDHRLGRGTSSSSIGTGRGGVDMGSDDKRLEGEGGQIYYQVGEDEDIGDFLDRE